MANDTKDWAHVTEISTSANTVTVAGTSIVEVKSGSINVANTPNVNISASSNTVKIGNSPEVKISASSNTVQIGNTPAVTLSGSGNNVNIANTPTVTVKSGSVTVANTPKVDISSTANGVTIENVAKVSISSAGNTVQIGNTPAVTLSGSGNNVNISNTPAVTVKSGSVNIANTPAVKISASSNTVQIGNSPEVKISASSNTVQIGGTATVKVASGSINIANTPAVTVKSGSVNISGTSEVKFAAGQQVTINSGTVDIGNTPDATIVNEQIPTTQIYPGSQSEVVAAGTGAFNMWLPFLSAGKMIELHKFVLSYKSANGYTYNLGNPLVQTVFADNQLFTSDVNTILEDTNGNVLTYYCRPTMANRLKVTLNYVGSGGAFGTLPAQDTVTLYWQIDGNNTALDTEPGFGAPVGPANGQPTMTGGQLATAGTSYLILGATAYPPNQGGRRGYLLIQNLSSDVMWISLGTAANNGQGSIKLNPDDALEFEDGFAPSCAIYAMGSVANAPYTVVVYDNGNG